MEESRKHSLGALARIAPLARSIVILAALGGCVAGSRATPAPDARDVEAIHSVLTAQTKSWNEGDVAGFVRGYAESERMTFIGSDGKVIRGRAALEERYRRSYSPGRMGTLTFQDLDIRRVGPDAYVVLGKWALARPPDDPHGVFTLLFERGPQGLQIVHDHSSGAE